jgi:heavy metal sensor kinase
LAETLAAIVDRDPALLGTRPAEGALAAELSRSQQERPEVAHALRVFSPEGRLLWKSPTARAQSVPAHVLERVQVETTVFETVASPEGAPVRQLFISLPHQGQPRYVLQAETSLLHYRTTLNGLVFLLALGSGATLLVAWVGSLWLAQKVLAPIEALCAGAETLSDADLGTRLALDAPYQEFRRLTQAVNAVLDQFQRSSEIQRSFCDIAAHEMKTPLTILQGNLEVALLKARTAEEYRDALITNLEQVGRLVALTRSLLTLAKFTSGKPPVDLTPLALEPLLQDLVEELTLLADDRRITLTLDSHPVPLVLGDAQWLKQALINLLDNALHYTPSGGAVTVRLHPCGAWVAVAVEDTGHGIEPEHLPHLFERFYRTDWARAKDAGGTGLGLPIVKEIAEAHGGTLAVTSQVDKGSVFTLRLPIPASQAGPA